MTESAYWLNGRLRTAAEAVLPITDHGLLYGDGIFEGIRFYNGKPFRLTPHLERLEASARALRLPLPYDRATMEAAVTETIGAFAEADGYLRLVVTRGSGPMGLDPSSCRSPNLFIIADRVAMVSDEKRRDGIEMITASTRRPGPAVLDPRIKSLNYLNNVLAKLEARHAGADEALLLNERGQVTEGTAENLFIARGGILYTPPVSDGALDGITRAVVLELCAANGIEARERSLTPYDIYAADECFLCGTGAELIPVRALDGRPLGEAAGALYRRVSAAFAKRIEQECR